MYVERLFFSWMKRNTRLWTNPLSHLCQYPFPYAWAFGTESQGVMVEIYCYEIGYGFSPCLKLLCYYQTQHAVLTQLLLNS